MKRLIFIFTLVISTYSAAQDLDKHRWINRVILVTAASEASHQLQQQVKALLNNTLELTDRKLIIYTVTPHGYTQQFPNQISTSNQEHFVANVPANTAFKIILIGLDGQVKLESSTVVSSSALFDTIDQMVMRKQELTKNSPQDY